MEQKKGRKERRRKATKATILSECWSFPRQKRKRRGARKDAYPIHTHIVEPHSARGLLVLSTSKEEDKRAQGGTHTPYPTHTHTLSTHTTLVASYLSTTTKIPRRTTVSRAL